MRIADVIKVKSSQDVVTIRPDATVRELIALLAQHNVGALVVSSDGRAVEGIVSERDVVRRLHDDEQVLGATVASIMTAEVRTAEQTEKLHDLMQLMTDHRIRHVPVVEDGCLCGIISIGDVVKRRIEDVEREAEEIRAYIATA